MSQTAVLSDVQYQYLPWVELSAIFFATIQVSINHPEVFSFPHRSDGDVHEGDVCKESMLKKRQVLEHTLAGYQRWCLPHTNCPSTTVFCWQWLHANCPSTTVFCWQGPNINCPSSTIVFCWQWPHTNCPHSNTTVFCWQGPHTNCPSSTIVFCLARASYKLSF